MKNSNGIYWEQFDATPEFGKQRSFETRLRKFLQSKSFSPPIFGIFVTCLLLASSIFGQNEINKIAADRALQGGGRVNPSTLAMEFEMPLGNYPGRGINVPISLNYSSKLWRMNYMGENPIPGGHYSSCYPQYYLEFAEDSASGWTSSLATPRIEYIGTETAFNYDGTSYSYNDITCPSTGGGNGSYPQYYIRRILVRLPSGETHEMRPDDSPTSGNLSNAANWDLTYYAVDGSNLKYIQNSSTGMYRLLMPDGSFYDFDGTSPGSSNRNAIKFTDRNGNFTTFYGPNSVDNNGVTHPNGYWKDTLGRNISVPVGVQAPASPTTASNPQIYSIPGLSGTSPVQYKLHWKRLEDSLTNSTQSLKYTGDRYRGSPGACNNTYSTYCRHPNGSYLFGDGNALILSNELFNPVVLTEIELPTGQSYKFSYDIYGRIDKITYPTGGTEVFTYSVVPTLSTLEPGDIGAQTNFGITNRKVYQTNGGSYYEWTYNAEYVAPSGYKITTKNPDNTQVQRFLHRGYDAGSGLGNFGFDNGLAGMVYETRVYDSSSSENLISRSLTNWATSRYTGGAAIADWHPRVSHVENYVFDPGGSGDYVWSTTKYEYESLTSRDLPLLQKKVLQYAFQSGSGGSSIAPVNPDTPPEPEPTPVPTPQPPSATLMRTTENTFLIYDSSVTNSQNYKDRNMVGLVTATVIKDGSGTVMSRSEIKYDETGYSPSDYVRGNPTTTRAWDSTKGAWNVSTAYLENKARFDTYGNQYEAIDAKGNVTLTEYSATYNYAFSTKVTTPIPDPNPTQNPDGQAHGSQTAFERTATFNFATGLPLTTTDANGLETRIEYDPATLRPINTKTFYQNQQVGNQLETVYHDEPNNSWIKLRTQIDADNWTESITYFNGIGRDYKVEEINSQGNIFVEKEFDAQGRIKRITNPYRTGETKQWTTNVYDEASRVKEVIMPDGAKIKTDYSVSTTGIVGVTKQITDQAGKKRKGISDSLGRMVRVIEDSEGQNLVTDYLFDTLDNLRKTIQGEQSRYFIHDSLGRMLYSKQPEQEANASFNFTDPITGNSTWSIRYEYDDNSNVTKATDARGVYMQGTYDRLNRLIFKDYSDSTPDVGFYYDGKYLNASNTPQMATGSVKGKTTGVKSSVSRTNFTGFDNLGRLIAHEQIIDGQTYQTSYTYNLSGALLEETYPSGRVVKNVLNNDGELTLLKSKKNSTQGFINYASGFKYATSGAIEKMRLGNGRWETAAYNNRLQITQIGLGVTDADQNLLKLEYSYGNNTQNNGSLREQKITVPNVALNQGFTAIQNYTYDDLNRIQSAAETVSGSQTWKQSFQYDRYGNRRLDTNNNNTTTLGACLQSQCNPLINTSDNRFSVAQGYLYDKAGNLTQDFESNQFFYDAENHQTEVRNSQNQTTGLYFYDGEGRRVKKVSAAETTIFVYDGKGQLVAEYSTALAQTPQVSYLTQDHLGSPRVITDQYGNVTTRKDYMAFGEETYTTQRLSALGYANQTETRKGYTGYEKDNESGLDFAQARYYSSQHGRFTSVDPLTASAMIKNPQTFNRYSYVLNSPYKFVDPLGLLSESTGACGSRCPNSGDSVDGSAFRGRDASFDWAKQQAESPEPPPEIPDYSSVWDSLPDTEKSNRKSLVYSKDQPFNSDKDQKVKFVKKVKNKGLIMRGKNDEPIANTKRFNCHSYTFHNGKGHPSDRNKEHPLWDDDPANIEADLQDYTQLDSNAPNKKKDIVIYYYDDDGNGRWDSGEEVIHSGKVTKVDKEGNTVLVKSKVGDKDIAENHPRAPGFYEGSKERPTSRAYFRRKKN